MSMHTQMPHVMSGVRCACCSGHLRALDATHVLATLSIAKLGWVALCPLHVVGLERIPKQVVIGLTDTPVRPNRVQCARYRLGSLHICSGKSYPMQGRAVRVARDADHVPQLVVERVALSTDSSVSDVNVQRATCKIWHIATSLPIIPKLLAKHDPLKANALEKVPAQRAQRRGRVGLSGARPRARRHRPPGEHPRTQCERSPRKLSRQPLARTRAV